MTAGPMPDPGHSKARALSKQEISHFDAIADFAYRRAGLVLPREKAPMVLARLSKRMRSRGVHSLEDYRSLLERGDAEDERRELIYSLTTNVTSFMREMHHFTALAETILPDLAGKARSGRRVRLWSAGCSSGQEPYSLAMKILRHIPDARSLDIRILATDIDARILARARSGTYSSSECDSLPEDLRKRFLDQTKPDSGGSPEFSIRDEVRALVSFRELNLLEPWPMRGRFDVVFCRNVIIYFDRTTQNKLWARIDGDIEDKGFLFVGHSERIDTSLFPQFKPSGTTTYQRLEHLANAPERK